jgi:hypothetical protein
MDQQWVNLPLAEWGKNLYIAVKDCTYSYRVLKVLREA